MKNQAQLVLGVLFSALVSAAFVISYAAIIYTGPLAEFLEHGIAVTLLGATVMSTIGALLLSYRGTILGPQDLPAILLASGAAAIVAEQSLPPDTLLATVATMVALTSVLTGALGFTLGRLRLAYLARFFPYPVLAGFLATTGVFLLLGGIEVALGPREAEAWGDYLTPDLLIRWGPVLVIAVAMTLATRVLKGYLVLPLVLAAALGAFFLLYAVIGLDAETLRARGLLLGPFGDGGFVGSLDPRLPLDADWRVILSHVPLILTTAVSALIGTALNASGLELAIKRDFDLNQELKGNGIANLVSGFFGGLPGYHVVGETLLASRLGLNGSLAGLSAAAGCAAVFVLGAGALVNLPVGFFAAIIAFLGIDLLFSWLWTERKRLGRLDFATLVFIPLIAVGYGFLTAIAIGLLLACILFIMEYSRLEIIRFESDLTTRRSLVERPDMELAVLSQQGHRAHFIELATFLFFGTSGLLRSKVQDALSRREGLEWLVLDFKHVPGIDVSTRQILRRIGEDCATKNIQLVLTGLPQKTTEPLKKDAGDLLFFPTLADGAQHVESALIAGHEAEANSAASQINALFSREGLDQFTDTVALQKGQHLVEEEAQSSDIYLLQSGQLRVVARAANGTEQTIAYIRPGAFVGEMAFYTGALRSAAIVADEASGLLRVNRESLTRLEAEHPDVAAQFHRLVARDMARRLSSTTALLRAFGA